MDKLSIKTMARLLRCPYQMKCKTCNCTFKERIEKVNYKPYTFDETFMESLGYLNYKRKNSEIVKINTRKPEL